jgi:hypothetical protein
MTRTYIEAGARKFDPPCYLAHEGRPPLDFGHTLAALSWSAQRISAARGSSAAPAVRVRHAATEQSRRELEVDGTHESREGLHRQACAGTSASPCPLVLAESHALHRV